jgi:chromosome partitioning protein
MEELSMIKPVIGTANQKGGVGKTTTIRIVGEYFARYLKKKILFCDMDSQYSLSARYLGEDRNPVTDQREPPKHEIYNPDDPDHYDWDGKSTIGDIFYGQPVLPYPTRFENIDIAPAHEAKLSDAENVKRQDIADKIYYRLNQFISLPEVQNKYDVFAIDTPPAKNSILTIASFKAMTHLIIPLEMETMAVEGLQGILTLWKQESLQRPADHPLHLIGVLASKYHSRRTSNKRMYDEIIKVIGTENVIPIKLFDRTQYPEVDSNKISIFDLPDSDEAKKECKALGEYIARRIFE